MRRSSKALLTAVLLLGATAALAVWQRTTILGQLMSREVVAITAVADPLAALPDGLHVGLCGAGSPLPDPQRSGPCTVVIAGKRQFVFDAGAAAARNIVRMGLNVGRTDAVFITHYHSDHIDGLGELLLQRWAQGAPTAPLPVHGPRGLEQVVQGFDRAYAADREWRVAHHGPETLPPAGAGALARPFELPADSKRQVLIAEPDLEVVAFAVEHEPVSDAVGYRIRYKDRVVVISGDTRRCDAMVRESRGADLLVHEALSPPMVAMFRNGLARAGRSNLVHVMDDVPSYHTTPVEAAQIARDAGVRMLVLSHIIPLVPPGFDGVFLQGTEQVFGGPIHLGVDGDWFSLPAGQTSIDTGRRL